MGSDKERFGWSWEIDKRYPVCYLYLPVLPTIRAKCEGRESKIEHVREAIESLMDRAVEIDQANVRIPNDFSRSGGQLINLEASKRYGLEVKMLM